MRAKVREWFPTLRQVEFTHAWGGYLGMPRDGMPIVSFDPATKLARLMGYTGRGVATTNLAARLLTGLITGRKSGLEHLPIHRRTAPRWEHEPLRWVAVRYVQNAMGRIDAAEEAGRALPWDAAIAQHLSRQ